MFFECINVHFCAHISNGFWFGRCRKIRLLVYDYKPCVCHLKGGIKPIHFHAAGLNYRNN